MSERALVEASGLTKRFGDFTAVDGLELAVEPGEVFGLLGPNGAGKTTTVRLLCGLIRPSAGAGRVAGVALDGDLSKLRASVGLLTESPGHYDRLTVSENLAFYARLYGVDDDLAAARAAEWLSRLGLWEFRGRLAAQLSKGMKQKLAIARALLHDPKVLFLDEPTSGLDPEAGRTVRDAIAELAGDARAVVLCSHNLTEVERLCRRVAIVKTRVLASGPLAELAAHGRPRATVDLADGAAAFLAAARAAPGVAEAAAEGRRLTAVLESAGAVSALVAALVQAGAAVRAVNPQQKTLEELYLSLVGAAPAPGVAA